MSEHLPKLRALEALVSQQLSEAGRRRIERHLLSCVTCRGALTSVRDYAALAQAARELPMPELSWDRVSTELDKRTHDRPSHVGKVLALGLPLFALAATVLVGWIAISNAGPTTAVGGRPPAAARLAPAPVPASAQAQTNHATLVDALVGWVTAGPKDTWAAGASVREGDLLRTERGQELHVHLSDDTGFVLWQESELRITRLRAGQVTLALEHGGISSVVRTLAVGSSYAVVAGTISAEVRGTRFFVGRGTEGVRVEVHEGRVAIAEQGQPRDLLDASGPHARFGASQRHEKERHVIGLSSTSKEWPTLTLPALPHVVAWYVAGVRWAGRTAFSVGVPGTEAQVSMEDAHGRLHPLRISIPPAGTTVSDKQAQAALGATQLHSLAPGDITGVIEAALPDLHACYQRSLLLTPDLAGTVTLAVRVAANGRVADASLAGQKPLPRELSRCISQLAKSWRFSAPAGSPTAFEINLNLTGSGGS